MNNEGKTCKEFMDADPGASKYKDLVQQGKFDELEKIFWKYVENSESEEVKVEYAADLP